MKENWMNQTVYLKSSVNTAKYTTRLATRAQKSEFDTNSKLVIYFVGNLFFLHIQK